VTQNRPGEVGEVERARLVAIARAHQLARLALAVGAARRFGWVESRAPDPPGRRVRSPVPCRELECSADMAGHNSPRSPVSFDDNEQENPPFRPGGDIT
jgi:hypothetical protein